jgi:hypothetical protein
MVPLVQVAITQNQPRSHVADFDHFLARFHLARLYRITGVSYCRTSTRKAETHRTTHGELHLSAKRSDWCRGELGTVICRIERDLEISIDILSEAGLSITLHAFAGGLQFES